MTMKRGRFRFYWLVQDGRCYLRSADGCKRAAGKMQRNGPRRATWDHVRPKSGGGALAFNSLLACSECNGAKGRALPSLLQEHVAQRIGMLWHKHVYSKTQRTVGETISQAIVDADLGPCIALVRNAFAIETAPRAPAA